MAQSKRPRRHRQLRETPAAEYASDRGEGVAGVLYDSDVIIEILRGRPPIVAAATDLDRRGIATFCTAIAWAEVHAGVRPGEELATDAFFEARGEVVLDGGVGRRAGAYVARYGRSHAVELADALVAAAAASTGLRLWTLNRKHYPMPDITFYDG